MSAIGSTFINGGPNRDRTDDLIVANDALSQVSYSPNVCLFIIVKKGCFVNEKSLD